MKETTYLSVLVLTCVIARTIKAVCLKGEIIDDALHLSCKVDWLKADVEIYSPDNKMFGSCPGPTELSKNLEICDKKLNMTQNLSTKTTKLVVNRTKAFSFYGEWMCKHGTGLGNDTFVVLDVHEHTDCSMDIWIFTTIFLSLVIIVLVVVMVVKPDFSLFKTKSLKLGTSPLQDEEMNPLLDHPRYANECLQCRMISVCAICVDCQCFFCELCCGMHIQNNPNHNMCMIEHTIESRFDVKCNKCEDKEPSYVCSACQQVLCDRCSETCTHDDKKVKIRLVKPKLRGERSISFCSSQLELLEQFDIKPTRVCGVCILSDGSIVIGDSENSKLLLRTDDGINEFGLPSEPRGLAHMLDKTVAITFAEAKKIITFRLEETDWMKVKELDMEGKPFSISYNENHFAVEIGEGGNGYIGVFSEDGHLNHRIPNVGDFAYFTGNSVRLALHFNKSRIFVSTLGKRAVSCVGFDGKIVWQKPMPSPRGIIFIPGIPLKNKNIVCASKRFNTVFEFGSNDGSYDKLISESKISSPQYIAYSYPKKKLCLQTDSGKLFVYKYVIK